MFDQAFGRNDLDGPGVNLSLCRDTEHATEMVDVAVGVDDSHDRTITAMVPVQSNCGGGRFGADQRIDHDHAGISLDERDVREVHVREVHAAYLIDPFDDLVQALLCHQGGLPPQAWVHRGRGIAGQKRVAVVVPHHSPVCCSDVAGLERAKKTPVGIVEIFSVIKRILLRNGGVRVDDVPACRTEL